MHWTKSRGPFRGKADIVRQGLVIGLTAAANWAGSENQKLNSGNAWEVADASLSVVSTVAMVIPGVGEADIAAVGAFDVAKELGVPAAESAMREAAPAAEDAMRMCMSHSFAAGTLVLMADGSKKPIEQVKVGDFVEAEDPTTGQKKAEKVDATWDNKNPEGWVEIMAGGGFLDVTSEHPFWVATLGTWIEAGHLRVGDQLLGADGKSVHVSGIRPFQTLADHYNLTVDQLHTYFAGDKGILVHNCALNAFPGAAAKGKIPAEWGPGQPARSGGGWRWSDPNAKPGRNYVRIDPGQPSSPDPLQQVDHVHVISGGVRVANHLPLEEWVQWATWGAP